MQVLFFLPATPVPKSLNSKLNSVAVYAKKGKDFPDVFKARLELVCILAYFKRFFHF